MTLEDKAKEYTTNIVLNGRASIDTVEEAYMDGYRQCQLDIADVIQWSAEKNELLETIELLNEQIEKMKCCGNCKHQCSFLFADESECLKNNRDKWELAE